MKADVLGTTADAGEIRCSLGYTETGVGISGDATAWGPWGFISRPPAPSENDEGELTGTIAWYVQEGHQKRVMGFRDTRLNPRVGALEPGDAAIVTLGEARLMLKAETDSVTLYTVSQPDDKSMAVTLDGSSGKGTILVGGAFIELQNGKITLAVNGGASLVIDGDTITVNGATFNANTGGGRLGRGVCAMPIPNPLAGIDTLTPVPTPSTAWFCDVA